MARETLPVALDLMFGHEGGYVGSVQSEQTKTVNTNGNRTHCWPAV